MNCNTTTTFKNKRHEILLILIIYFKDAIVWHNTRNGRKMCSTDSNTRQAINSLRMDNEDFESYGVVMEKMTV
jgi:hypothetical protein